MGTWIVGTVLAVVVVLILRDMAKKRRRGECVSSCGGNCSQCHGGCAGTPQSDQGR